MKQSDVMKLPDGRHLADRGLYLEVRGDGRHRSWLLIIKKNGVRKAYGLGSATTMTLAMAREKTDEMRGMIARGIDPRPREEKQVAVGNTFLVVAKEAIEARARVSIWKNEKHAKQWTTTVEQYAIPILGEKDVADITRADILAVLNPIWETKTETAMRLRSRLETIFDYALRQGWREAENPAKWRGGLEFDLPAASKILNRKNMSAMTMAEACEVAPTLWHLAKSGQVGPLCILFGLLTAARCTEFCLADWSEIDLKKGVWCVPPERRKDKKKYPHRVPLSRQAIALLEMLPSREGPVFPGRRAKTVHLETPRLMLRRLVKRDVTMHGCRSTFRDWCAETGKDSVLAEKSLMHATGNEVEQAYQRSDLLDLRRELMQQWADAVLVKL